MNEELRLALDMLEKEKKINVYFPIDIFLVV